MSLEENKIENPEAEGEEVLINTANSVEEIENFKPFDDFKEESVGNEFPNKQVDKVHLRVQKRTGKKYLTTIQGIPTKFSLKKLLKAFKKEFCCNGTIVEDEELGSIIQLQGDKRKEVAEFLLSESVVDKANLQVHGF